MVTDTKALATREAQLEDALGVLTKMHGAQSETVALIRKRLDAVHVEIIESQGGHVPHVDEPISLWGGPKVKDAAVMYILLGGTLIFAFSGVSTMFLVLMAVRLGAL